MDGWMDGIGRRVQWVLVYAIVSSGKYVDGWIGKGREGERKRVYVCSMSVGE